MIFNTTGGLFIIHSNAFLQKKCVFLYVRNLTLIYGPYSCLIAVLFASILMENFVCFFKCSLNFRAHALQSELSKTSISNFVKVELQSMDSIIERAFEKTSNIFYQNMAKKDIYQATIRTINQCKISYMRKKTHFCCKNILLCIIMNLPVV